MDADIDLHQVSMPPSTKVQLYNNGDDTYKAIVHGIKMYINKTTPVMGDITFHRIRGLNILDNFVVVEWGDIPGTVYILPNKNDQLYEVKINSIAN